MIFEYTLFLLDKLSMIAMWTNCFGEILSPLVMLNFGDVVDKVNILY